MTLLFNDYILKSRDFIQEHRLDLKNLKPLNAQKILDANSPFELRPAQTPRYGALLLHGLLDSPFFMRDIGIHLQSHSPILTRAVLLPGHGTLPAHLLKVHYQEWIDTVNYGVESLLKEVDKVILIGFSTGGALALHHAISRPEKIAGIAAIAPALRINSPIAFTAHWHRFISSHWARGAWFYQDKEEMLDYSKYRSIPFNAIAQVYALGQAIKKMPLPYCPLFFAVSEADQVICSKTVLKYFQKHTSSKNRLLWYTDIIKNTFSDTRIIQRQSCYPEMKIKNFSHITLPIAPDNPHYGINGDYREASHVNKTTNTIYGEFSEFKIRRSNGRYQRLTFNPDFGFLADAIGKFIANLDR